jgi:hypothetical protein
MHHSSTPCIHDDKFIFLGFSFGGMLACYNAAKLWDKAIIGVDVLEKSIACVTFGQPLLPIPYVYETIRKYPKFDKTIHSICDEEDIFPRVLYSNYGQIMSPETSMRALTGNNGGNAVPKSEYSDVSQLVHACNYIINMFSL